MHFTAREGKSAKEVLAVVDEELERLTRELVTDDELERVKARMELGLLQGMETAGGKAEQIGFYEMVLGDPAHPYRRLEAYRRTTSSELRWVARRYLDRGARTRIHVVPDGSAPEPDGDSHEEGAIDVLERGEA